MEIAQAGIDDLDLLVPLFEGYRQFYGGKPAESEARRFIAERIERSQSIILLAIDGDAGCGFVQLYPLFSSVSMQPLLILDDLFVEKAYRRRGLASQLLQAAEDYARSIGVARLRLSTQHSNAGAQALYEQAGWELDQEFRSYNRAL